MPASKSDPDQPTTNIWLLATIGIDLCPWILGLIAAAELQQNHKRTHTHPVTAQQNVTDVQFQNKRAPILDLSLRVLVDCVVYRLLVIRCKIIEQIDKAQTTVLNVFRALRMLSYGYLGTGEVQEPEDIPKNATGPVWILGRCYRDVAAELEAIRDDVNSRLWFTYRRCFTPVGSPQLTTDKGWGCMLRCGQMILAQTLVQLHLGREWRWTSETRDPSYLNIINLFEDNRKSGFSLRQIALMGNSEDKKVGQWFGPNTVAQVLKKLIRYEEWCNLDIHVAMDNMVVIEDILEQNQSPGTKQFQPLLLMVNLRLGITEINPIYLESLKSLFEVPGCVGMIGGRPNQALYFFGFVGEEALFLDPHTTQNAGTVGQKLEEEEIQMDATYHQKYAMRINFRQIDPSLAVGFLSKTRDEFDQLCDRLRTIFSAEGRQPLFEISRQRLAPWAMYSGSKGGACSSRVHHDASAFDLDEDDDLEGSPNSDDEFEIIA